MRYLLPIALCLFSVPAEAAIYNIDIFHPENTPGILAGPTGSTTSLACSATSCGGGFGTAYSFYAQPGDTLNFGTLLLGSFIFGDGRQSRQYQYLDADGHIQWGYGTPMGLYRGVYGVSYQYRNYFGLPTDSPIGGCTTADPNCMRLLQNYAAELTPIEVDLTYTLGDSGFIELGWLAATYIPPAVPEPSTWAMMLLGFFGIVLYRRTHHQQSIS